MNDRQVNTKSQTAVLKSQPIFCSLFVLRRYQKYTVHFNSDIPFLAESSYTIVDRYVWVIIEPEHDKTNTVSCASSEDSDQPGHRHSLIRVFDVRSVGSYGPQVTACDQRRLWSDWADARLIWVFGGRTGHFVGFVVLWLNSLLGGAMCVSKYFTRSINDRKIYLTS